MGETAAAGGVFMGLGLRGVVRGSGVAEAVGVTVVPLEDGPEVRVKMETQMNQNI